MTAIAELEERVSRLESEVRILRSNKVRHRLALFGARNADGSPRKQRYPDCWFDLPVREAVIALHRQTSIAKAVAQLVEKFGEGRAPSKSALARIWKQLDLVIDPSS